MTSSLVDEWSEGRWYARITCARGGHAERLIDRLTLDAHGDGSLYLSWHPEGEHDFFGRERSTLVADHDVDEDGGFGPTYAHHALKCPACSLEVRISRTRLTQLASGLRDAGVPHLDLGTLAATLSKQ